MNLSKIKIPENEAVRIANNQIFYFLKENYTFDLPSQPQSLLNEVGRALTIAHLIDVCKVLPATISLEDDLIIIEKPELILASWKIGTRKKFEFIAPNKLFSQAKIYANTPGKSCPTALIAYEIYCDDEIEIKGKWFYYPEIEKILETQQITLKEIIARDSIFAYEITPDIFKNPAPPRLLTEKDLLDIRNVNGFKNLLKKLPQKFKSYGVSEEKFFEMVIKLFLAKTFDELRSTGNKILDFQVKPGENKSEFYNRIKSLYETASIELLGEIPQNSEILKHEKKEEILLETISYFQRLRIRSLRFTSEDLAGDLFQDLLSLTVKKNGGLFFTHPNVCRFVCKALNIQEGGTIIDPSCGSGTFLIEASRLIAPGKAKNLFGIDIEPRVTALCKVNMAIQCDSTANIYTADALAPLENLPLPFAKEILKDLKSTPEVLANGADFVLSNPPFSVKIARENFKMKDFAKTNTSECLFIERWYQLLKPGGRLGVVLPISFFDGTEYLKARLLFLCYFKVIAIVGLPEHTFSPYAQQKTVLVFAQKRTHEESDNLLDKIEQINSEKVIFYEAKNVGYVRSLKRGNVITTHTNENDLNDEIVDVIRHAFEGNLVEHLKITVKSLGEVYQDGDFVLIPSLAKQERSNLERFTLWQDWDIVEIKKVLPIETESLLICETGDIVPNGVGIIMPQRLNNSSAVNRERIKRKILAGKFGTLEEGDIIIAPVRIYQRKIAVVTRTASSFLYSKDFIVLRRKKQDLNESFRLFLTLIHPLNVKLLENLSIIGKSGYPKIRSKKAILQTKFYKVNPPIKRIVKFAKLYEEIYKEILKNLT